MNSPRVISTLAEAAKWMTESTGIEWTSDNLLSFIFREMVAAASREPDDEGAEHRLAPVSYLYIALPTTTRVVRRWYDDTLTVRTSKYEQGDTAPLTLENYEHVHDLLMHGAIELPYPLTSEPWNGYEGYWIDADTAPIITPESLQIHDDDLCVLSAIYKEQNQEEATLK